jgi:hypothetical protein
VRPGAAALKFAEWLRVSVYWTKAALSEATPFDRFAPVRGLQAESENDSAMKPIERARDDECSLPNSPKLLAGPLILLGHKI